MQETCYSVLEIEETATQEEIKSAFRTLVKRYHPDNMKQVMKKNLKRLWKPMMYYLI